MTPLPAGARLVLVLGDQLTLANPALLAADPSRDRVLLVECMAEGRHAWSHKARIALFLSAMRHFTVELRAAGFQVDHLRLGEHAHDGLDDAWRAAIRACGPSRVLACEPGDHRVEALLQACCAQEGVPLDLLPDTHFLVSRDEFARWAGPPALPARPVPRALRMETFYRWMRKRTGWLMEGDEPAGGQWNYDADNRESFGKAGPPARVPLPVFAPDATSREVMATVERVFPDHPGALHAFSWPVTRADALRALTDFVEHRLPDFGRFQDAMWSGEPFLFHSLLAPALNLKLLDPREVIEAAVAAHAAGRAPLASVEGFVRQILGWREFVRGLYWLDMPAMAQANALDATQPLPAWFWTGDTRMRCMRETIGQTLEHGYAHHIQRLMVTGNFALVAGLAPQDVCDWYLSVYVDAVDWVERPNVAGMALFATGARFTSKPYAASGQYVKRMSDYCTGCAYRPEKRTGDEACPTTVFFWDFLLRHQAMLAANARTALMAANARRLSDEEAAAIRAQAMRLRERLDAV